MTSGYTHGSDPYNAIVCVESFFNVHVYRVVEHACVWVWVGGCDMIDILLVISLGMRFYASHFQANLVLGGSCISCEIVPRLMSPILTDDVDPVLYVAIYGVTMSQRFEETANVLAKNLNRSGPCSMC